MSFLFSILADAAAQAAPVAEKVTAVKAGAGVPGVDGGDPFVFGEFVISHDGLLQAAIIIGVAFVLSHVVKRAFAFVAERLGTSRPLAGS